MMLLGDGLVGLEGVDVFYKFIEKSSFNSFS
jgi:hypothetical protein